jgi:hypothetical protein
MLRMYMPSLWVNLMEIDDTRTKFDVELENEVESCRSVIWASSFLL